MKSSVFETPEAIGDSVAVEILQGLAQANSADRRYLLGCPTGRTPRPIYNALARRLAASPVDLSRLVLVMMDEYIRPSPATGAPELVDPQAHFSCQGFAERAMRSLFNAAVPETFRLPKESVWFPDPSRPGEYDTTISDSGGVDLFIVASGASDGHVAFNPAGSARDSMTRIVELSETTRRDNLSTFPDFQNITEVPERGVSVGLATIAAAHRCRLVLSGANKREAYRRVVGAGRFDSDWPSTIVFDCPDYTVLADRAAAGVETEGSR